MTTRIPDETAPPPAEEADFGYRRIPAAEKAGAVRGVFESVADRYDLMNDLMSGGIHRLWKDAAWSTACAAGGRPYRVLDLAGGTGDIAFRILARAPDARVAVVDLTPAMLAVGRDRAIDRGLVAGIGWAAGNAESLPLADRSVDAVTIAFGLRNVTRRDRALAEVRRVLRPGGPLPGASSSAGSWYPGSTASTTPIPSRCCRTWAAWSRATASRTATWSRASAASPTRRRWPAR
jgi:demethylmenaquinone methyltransferase/2-methoxy-6-polyprenyl-1,4-benzoquinol methylase